MRRRAVSVAVALVAALVGAGAWWFGRGERNPPPPVVASVPAPVRAIDPSPQATLEPAATRDAVGVGSTYAEAAPPSAAGAAEAHLARGEFIAERTVADSVGASKEGLLEAEAELKAALAGGVADRKRALLLLADVYNSLQQRRWSGTFAATARYVALEREVRREIVQRHPQDADAHYRYGVTLVDDPGARVRELEEAVHLDPDHLLARRALGFMLLQVGRTEEGARTLLDVAHRMPTEDLAGVGYDVVAVLKEHGRPREAREIERLMAGGGQER